jgi:AbrB family looped-hinge helix DNA binding protein
MPSTDRVKVSKKYQVVIPERIRRDAGIKPGDEMIALSKHGVLQYVRIRPISETKGLDSGVTAEGLRDEED